jgi:hypothetical protein
MPAPVPRQAIREAINDATIDDLLTWVVEAHHDHEPDGFHWCPNCQATPVGQRRCGPAATSVDDITWRCVACGAGGTWWSLGQDALRSPEAIHRLLGALGVQ